MGQLLEMQWGQIYHKEDGVWLKVDRSKRKRYMMPAEAWDAIRAYLVASGRWDQMKPQDYIFAPMADPMRRGATGKAEEWDAGRHMRAHPMRNNLLRFAKRVGIDAHHFTMSSLRNTAVMMRREAGDDPRNFLREVERYGGTAVTLAKSLANKNKMMETGVEALARQFLHDLVDDVHAEYAAGREEARRDLSWGEDGILAFPKED